MTDHRGRTRVWRSWPNIRISRKSDVLCSASLPHSNLAGSDRFLLRSRPSRFIYRFLKATHELRLMSRIVSSSLALEVRTSLLIDYGKARSNGPCPPDYQTKILPRAMSSKSLVHRSMSNSGQDVPSPETRSDLPEPRIDHSAILRKRGNY